MPQITIGAQKLSYRQQGEGRPPLLLIHGAGQSSVHFSELMGVLGRHCWTVALDLPGHGGSPPLDPLPPVSELLQRYRDLAAEFAERIGLGKFMLVGHSMGGAVAQLFALSMGERLAGLVLVATSGRLKVAPMILQAIREHFDGLPAMIAAVGYSPAASTEQVARWSANQIQAPQQVVLDDFRACAQFDVRDQLGEISCPVSIISAADDRLTPPMLQQQLQKRIPRSELVHVSRAGHFVFMERPDVVAQAILEARVAAIKRAAG